MIGFGILFGAARLIAPRAAPALLRRYLQWCGGGFIKLGQVMAMRFDMLPPAYCQELMHLLDRARPVSVRRIRQIIAAELGARAADLLDFDPVPLGSASIAQVHGARLADGSAVVVKVMRPNVARRLRVDMANLSLLARLAEMLGVFGSRNITGLVAEVARLSSEELDFRREAFQADLMHKRLAADELDHCAPRVFFAYCATRVITMEALRGVWVRELIAKVEARDEAALAAFAERGIHPRRTARLILRSILTQCLVHRVFHADPHAANIVVLDGGTIGYIDFGMLGRLDERLAGLQLRIIEAIASERFQAAFDAMLGTIEPLTVRDLDSFQVQIQDLFATWRMIAGHPQATVAEKSSGLFFLRVADVVRRVGLQLPSRMTRYYRAQIVSDMAIYGLDPLLDPVHEFTEFFAGLHARLLSDALSRDKLLAAWRTLAVDGPRAAEQLVRWVDLRLPRLGERHGKELTSFERAGALILRYVERGLWLAGGVVIAMAIAGRGDRVQIESVPWWGVTAMLLGLAYTLRRAHQAMMDPD
jgi:ubiquinone biosynthesis protein